MRYPNKEVNCTEPSPSVRVPWSRYIDFYRYDIKATIKLKSGNDFGNPEACTIKVLRL